MSKKSNETPRIRQWRQAAGLTQAVAAKKLGIHRTTLAQLENWTKPIGKRLAAKIAPFAKQSTGELMDEYERKAS